MMLSNDDQTSHQKLLFDEVFLQKLERLALLSRQAMAGQMLGDRRSNKQGQSIEFADFRPYVSGDDIRRIDWNAYARLERFFIKLFIEEEDLSVHIILDNSLSMDWGSPNKFDFAVKAAGALGYVVLAGLDQISVYTLGKTDKPEQKNKFGPIRGKNRAFTLFNYLQSLSVNNQFPVNSKLTTHLYKFAATTTYIGPLLLLSDLMDDGWQTGLNKLAAKGFDITILHILSPDEINPNINGDYKLIDRETASSLEITADYDTIESYRKNLAEWKVNWKRFCGSRGIQYLTVPSNTQLEDLLFAHLRRQGVLR